MEELMFEDFTVGRVFTSGTATVSAADIKRFAAEFDPQPQHLDEDAARSSAFGELVASGWHTAGITMRLQLAMALNRVKGGAVGVAMEGVAWPKPVRPDDTLQVTVEVMAARVSKSRPDRGLLTLLTITRNQHGDVVQQMTATVLAPVRNRATS